MASGPKQKTQKTAAKRVKRTGTGKILPGTHADCRATWGRRETEKHQRRLAHASVVSPADVKQLNRLVPPGSSR